jgi:hypothetical protein
MKEALCSYIKRAIEALQGSVRPCRPRLGANNIVEVPARLNLE